MKLFYNYKKLSDKESMIISIEEVKNYLKIHQEQTQDNEILEMLVKSVVTEFEMNTNVLLNHYDVELQYHYRNDSHIYIPYQNISRIIAVQIIDDFDHIFDFTNYTIVGCYIHFNRWPYGRYIKITLQCGSDPASDTNVALDQHIKHTLLQHIAYCYQHRTEGTPEHIKRLYTKYKKYQI